MLIDGRLDPFINLVIIRFIAHILHVVRYFAGHDIVRSILGVFSEVFDTVIIQLENFIDDLLTFGRILFVL